MFGLYFWRTRPLLWILRMSYPGVRIEPPGLPEIQRGAVLFLCEFPTKSVHYKRHVGIHKSITFGTVCPLRLDPRVAIGYCLKIDPARFDLLGLFYFHDF